MKLDPANKAHQLRRKSAFMTMVWGVQVYLCIFSGHPLLALVNMVLGAGFLFIAVALPG